MDVAKLIVWVTVAVLCLLFWVAVVSFAILLLR